mmetsp:Transcript_6012/g.18120  ORF Transcript_6012/g.18120 Transcript_6012/m.18120 type:complete len:97 (-) Transcript_6012:1358-1648(-)
MKLCKAMRVFKLQYTVQHLARPWTMYKRPILRSTRALRHVVLQAPRKEFMFLFVVIMPELSVIALNVFEFFLYNLCVLEKLIELLVSDVRGTKYLS